MKDHREIGRQLDLFMFSELSPGCPIWLPRGNTLYTLLSDKVRDMNKLSGYVEVRTPVLWKTDLFKKSGHWDHFKQNMFLIDPREDNQGDEVRLHAEPEFALKPMNCPGNMVIFGSRQWSYRDLPYRIHDQGMLHRNEPSGSLGGLTRVRSFCQDDGHIFCTPETLGSEIEDLVEMVEELYEEFGLSLRATLSTRPAGFMGTKKEWDHAEGVLKESLSGMNYQVAEGEGAFYGPKIDFMVKDSFDREWQTATIQLDFQLPQRFELKYADAHDIDRTPIVIHRAMYGSLERFIALLLEHTQGDLPAEYAPVQAIVCTVSEKHIEYAKQVHTIFCSNRVELDISNIRLPQKIALAETRKIPYIAVVGDKEVETQTVTVRRDGKQGVLGLNEFLSLMLQEGKFRY
jgi:threonyl-tRNA synthetase